jgi:hypothetical protein
LAACPQGFIFGFVKSSFSWLVRLGLDYEEAVAPQRSGDPIALANKLARIAWNVLARERIFEGQPAA